MNFVDFIKKIEPGDSIILVRLWRIGILGILGHFSHLYGFPYQHIAGSC